MVEDEEEEDEDEDEDEEEDCEEEIEEAEEEERDLDEHVPEGDVTFNSLDEESLLEGSMLERPSSSQEREEQERYARLEEEELTGVAREREDLGLERDLDDSVPEAGEYEHTDTELEDTTEDIIDESALGMSGASRRSLRNNRESVGARSLRSLRSRDISSLLDSSFIGSSPVTGRRGIRDRSNC
ncbi:hypothetical protein H2203_001305 [Taxawa tesnikishii (nom. ined.)]|nr:hypothetical protein H2203_001305 [Dothideales sp. JES 119]